MANKQIVKSYDADLDLLNSKLSEMGQEVEDQITKANQKSLAFESLRPVSPWPRILEMSSPA